MQMVCERKLVMKCSGGSWLTYSGLWEVSTLWVRWRMRMAVPSGDRGNQRGQAQRLDQWTLLTCHSAINACTGSTLPVCPSQYCTSISCSTSRCTIHVLRRLSLVHIYGIIFALLKQ